MAESTEMTTRQREVIFEDMDKVTQKAAQEGLKKLQAGYQVAVLIQYDLGEVVNRVFDAEHLNDDQKKQEIKKLAAYWNQPNLNATTLYDLRNVSATFDRDFVKAQLEERMSNGGYLTWSHFKELQKIESESKQLTILKKIRQHSWSANELALELQGRKDAAIKRSGGRKPLLPKTPVAMLQKLLLTVQQTDNYVEAVSEPMDTLFMELSSSDVDEQFVENINDTLERIEETTSHLSDMQKRLRKVQKRALKVLEAADNEDEAEEAAPKKRGRPPKAAKSEDADEAAAPKKRGRPPKVRQEPEDADNAEVEAEDDEDAVVVPKRRGRPPKVRDEDTADSPTIAVAAKADLTDDDEESEAPRRRGRPPRAEVVAVAVDDDEDEDDEDVVDDDDSEDEDDD